MQSKKSPSLSVSQERTAELFEFIQTYHRIRDKTTHSRLQADLVEPLRRIPGA